jgi:hypothetical protein
MTQARHPGVRNEPLRLLQFTDLHLCGDEPGRETLEMDDRPPACRWLHLHPDGHIDGGIEWLPQE